MKNAFLSMVNPVTPMHAVPIYATGGVVGVMTGIAVLSWSYSILKAQGRIIPKAEVK